MQLLKKLLYCCILLLVAAVSRAQLISGNAFIQGQFVQVGISPCGSFGSGPGVNAPVGYNPRSVNHGNQLGFVADAGMDGWTTGTPDFVGDYFIPDTPEEGFGLTINGVNYNNNLLCATNSIPGSIVNWQGGSAPSATWQGNIAGLSISSTTFIPAGAVYFVTRVTLTNPTTAMSPINNIFYMRNVDPDQGVSTPGGGNTNITVNNIDFQNDICNRALVSAVTTSGNFYLGLGSIDPRARVTHGGFGNRSAANIWNGVGFSQAGSNTADKAISIAFNIGTLNPGQSTTLSFVYILNQSQLDQALQETITGVNVAGVPYMSGSTAGTCPGSVPLTINNPGSYTWTWSPATGLSSTSGTSVTATVTTPVTYTATGVGPCGTAITTITLSPTGTPPPITAYSSISYCQGATASPLLATGTNLLWYTTPTGGTGSPITPVPSTAFPGVTYYYVSQTIGSCDESARTPVMVVVNALPPAPSVSTPKSVCQKSTPIKLAATGSNLLWYNSPLGGTPSATPPAPHTTTIGSSSYWVSQTINGCESPRAEIVVNVIACGVIDGQVHVCPNSTIRYELGEWYRGVTYTWTVVGGTPSSTTGLYTNVSWGNVSGPASITVTGTDANGNIVLIASLDIVIEPLPTPFITVDNLIGCVKYGYGVDEDMNVILDLFNTDGYCMKTCSYSTSTFSVHALSGSTYTWAVTGGTILSTSGNTCTVQWGGPGYATVTVTETNAKGCIGTRTNCIELIEGPQAGFRLSEEVMASGNACLDQELFFADLSQASPGSPIISWQWDFGDGTVINSSSSSTPSHIYHSPGTYKILLTVTNECHCTSVFEFDITISDQPNFTLECPGVVCEGQQVTYTIKEKDQICDSYYWRVEGGTVISEAADRITILWDKVDDDGFGYVHYHSECSSCPGTVSAKIPVIKKTGKIKGPNLLCKDQYYLYRLPAWPGTKFTWEVNNGIAELKPTDQPNEVSIFAKDAGVVTLKCTYYNSLLDCGGTAFIKVTILSKEVIHGVDEACLGSSLSYSIPSTPGVFYWKLQYPNGTIVTSAASVTTFNTGTLTVPGKYIISITSTDICPPDPLILTVYGKPPVPSPISGSTVVCTGTPYEYTVSSVPGTNVEWNSPTINTDVFFVGSQQGNRASVIFTGSATTYVLQARRINNQRPYCASDWYSITINREVINIPINGAVSPCPSSVESYNTPYTGGEYYSWEVIPATAGSISSGNGTRNVNVTWNNTPGSFTLRLTMRKCGADYVENKVVNVSGAATITPTLSSGNVCRGETVTVSHNGAAINTTLWDFGNGVTQTTTNATSVTYSYPAQQLLAGTNVNYTITATISGPSYCTPVTVTIPVTVKPSPVAYITPVTDYSECVLGFTHTYTANIQSGYEPVASYTWYKNGSAVAGPCTSIGSPYCYSYDATDYGSYYVLASSSNGCTAASGIVNINVCSPTGPGGTGGTGCSFTTLPAISTSITSQQCVHAELSGNPVGGSSPVWTSPMAATNITTTNTTWVGDFTAAVNHKIIYTATFLDDDGDPCQRSAEQYVLIEVIPDLLFNHYCTNNGYFVTLLDHSSYYPGTAITGYDFYVDYGSGFVLVSPPGNTSNNFQVVLPSGNYVVKEVVHYGSGKTCEVTKPLSLGTVPTVDFTFTDNICEGVPFTFTNTGTDYTQCLWDFGDLSQNTLVSVNKTFTFPLGSTSYTRTVTLTNTNAQGCSVSISKVVNVQQNTLAGTLVSTPSATPPSPLIVCDGTPVTLSFNDASTTPGPESYAWYNHTTLLMTTSSVSSYQVSNTGYYWLKVRNAQGCQLITPTIPVIVNNVANPVIAGEHFACEQVPYKLMASVGGGVTYQWTRDGSPVGSNSPELSEDPPPPPGATYQYEVTVTPIGSSCSKTAAAFPVTVFTKPDIPTISYSITDCNNFTADLYAGSSTAGTFNWSNGMYGQNVQVNIGGAYKLWFTDDVTGCTSSAEAWIPKPANEYIWTFPTGCFSRCIPPDILVNGPIIPMSYWEWWQDGSMINNGGNSVLAPLSITATGVYELFLMNDMCNAQSGRLYFTLPPEEACDQHPECEKLGYQLLRIYSDGCNIVFDLDLINNGGYVVTYSILSSLGGSISPSSGIIPPGGVSESFVWTPDPLSVGGGITFTIRIYLPDGTWCDFTFGYEVPCQEGGRAIPVVKSKMGDPFLKLVPNPAQQRTVATYRLNESTSGWQVNVLEVYDINGKRLFTDKLNNKTGMAEINTSTWPNGVYVVQLRQNGRLVKTEKLVVAR